MLRPPYGTLLLLLAGCAAPAPPVDADLLVERLGSEVIEEREAAFYRLVDVGSRALVEVQKGLRSADSEIAARCRELLEVLAPHGREVRIEVGHWLRHAIQDFDRERYDRCMRLCDAVLVVDPDYPVALKIREFAQKARHIQPLFPFEGRFAEWERQTLGRLPEEETFRLPAPEAWPELRRTALAGLETQADCVDLALDTTRITIDVDRARYSTILDVIREKSRLNIVEDAATISWVDSDSRLTVHLENRDLRTVLRRVLREMNLDFRVTAENVVLIVPAR